MISNDQLHAEDPRAWTASGVFRVADGVWRVPLPLPIVELGQVNFYIFADHGEVVLVDPGWAIGDSDGLVVDALATLGFTMADVTLIVSTHNHLDHYSAAMQLRRTFGTPISLGELERRTVEGYIEATADGPVNFFPLHVALAAANGHPELADRIAVLPPHDYERDVRFEVPDLWLEDGQLIPLGDRELTIYQTPGHTRGHIVVADWSRGVVVTGDHVLPRITPSIGMEFAPEGSPLASFMASLERMLELPDAVMLPAHGNISEGIHHRVRALLQHHEDRLDIAQHLVEQGALTAADVADRMVWTRADKSFDELPTFHQMAALTEVAAHLDVLLQRGRVRRHLDGDRVSYTAESLRPAVAS